MAKKTVYIETSVVSYLTARPTQYLLTAARQTMTVDWWSRRREQFDLYTSDVTFEEAGKGDPEAGMLRLEALSSIPILPTTQAAVQLSRALLDGKALPAKAINDALHIAISAVHGIDYLLTWNYRHIDNAETKPVIRDVCAGSGYDSPEICTPEELMGGFSNA